MKLASDTTEKEAGNTSNLPPKTGGAKVRLLTLADLDKRTTAAKRAREIIDALRSDLGGADQLATGEAQLIQHAGMLGTMAEDIEARWLSGQPVDPTVLCTLANAQRRLFETVGLRRRPRDCTPSVADYVASLAVEEKAGAA